MPRYKLTEYEYERMRSELETLKRESKQNAVDKKRNDATVSNLIARVDALELRLMPAAVSTWPISSSSKPVTYVVTTTSDCR